MSLAPGARLGPYEIVALLGAGGMGEVYRAADTRLNRTVAIKVLPSEFADDPMRRERFEREARVISSLTHPHICALYDVGQDRGLDFLVMEYLEGDTLDHRLVGGPLALDLALRYGCEIADALDHAHRRGVTHRDLKPSNVMVTASGVKILDFGLASTADRFAGLSAGAGERTLTADGNIVGTLQYMAPEQLDGRAVDARSDIFSLGALLHETITGSKAFGGTSQAAVLAAILRDEPPALGTIQPLAPALDRAIGKCLAKNPDDRWQTARDLESELRWIRQDSGRSVGWGSSASGRDYAGRVPRRKMIVGFAVLVVVSALAAFLMRNQSARDIAPIEFTVAAPEGSAFIDSGSFLAVSPDGRSLTFLARGPDGREMLWVRHMETGAMLPLAGTEGARAPFWSPDSQHIGFVANRSRLKTIDASGANLHTLCEVGQNALGGTWNRDGVILFSGNGLGAGLILNWVRQEGGPPVAVTTLDRSDEDVGHTWPQFLPDGKNFLYRIRSGRQENTGIYAGSLGSRDRKRVLSRDSNPVYVGPDYLVYGELGSLFALHFEPSTLTVTGSPILLAQQVMYNDGTGRSAFAVSDSVLAYRQVPKRRLTWFDRTGTTLATASEPGHYLDPSLSPDGSSIAVSLVDAELGASHIWLMDAAGRSARRLTEGRQWDRGPLWSPDSRSIVYASRRAGQSGLEIYRKSIEAGDSREIRLVTGHGGNPYGWLANQSLLFEYEGTRQLGTVRADGSAPPAKVSSRQQQLQVQVSADTQWVAYVSNETGTNEVYIRPAASADQTGERVSVSGGVEPKWRRDGQELFYLALDGQLMAVDVRGSIVGKPHALFLTRASTALSFIGGRNQYDVAPDGQRFLMNIPETQGAPITVLVNWMEALRR